MGSSAASPFREGVYAGITILVVSCVGLGLVYRAASDAQADAIKTELSQLARSLAVQIDGDAHRQFVSPAQMGSPEHLRALAPMLAFHQATSDLIYVYTAILRDGQTYFVLGTDYLYRVPGDNLPPDPIMKRYEGNDPKLMQALTGHIVTVTDKPVQEQLGAYMSAYAPFYDSQRHFVGVVGIDMRLTRFAARQASLRRAALLALLAVGLLSVVGGAIVARLRNATERANQRDREAVAQLARSKLQADALNQQLVLAVQQAQQHAAAAVDASKAKSVFLATMSHEIRTPMNGIVGTTDLLLRTPLSEKQRLFAQTVANSGQALLKIINDVLDFSRIEAGKLELERKDFNLRESVEDAANLLAGAAHKKGLELVCLLPQNLPQMVTGDAGRLRQVLLNLISNAIKFTESGEVVISVAPARTATATANVPALLRFEVRDTGVGLARDAPEKIFDAFVQSDGSTTRRFGGSGLGLAIAKQLVTLMGGEINYSSELGKGSNFWFTAQLPSAAAPSATQRLGVLSQLRVLIVDDHAATRAALSGQLTSWGVVNSVAENASQALQLLRAAEARGEHFDAALIAQDMPGMDGKQLLRAIRSNPWLVDMGAILLTRVDDGIDDEIGTKGDLLFTLTKPVRQSQLLDCLHGIANPGAPMTGAKPAAASAIGHARLLLVEDNEVNQLVATAMLESLGCRPDLACNGREAVTAHVAARYDLIFMDIQMPEMDGLSATALIRQRETAAAGQRRTPIIALTANAMSGDRERFLAAGMDDHLSKPFRLEDLVTLLQRWLPAEQTATV